MFDCWNGCVVTCQISEPVACRSNLTAPLAGELPSPKVALHMPTAPTVVLTIWRMAARLVIGQLCSLFDMVHLCLLLNLIYPIEICCS